MRTQHVLVAHTKNKICLHKQYITKMQDAVESEKKTLHYLQVATRVFRKQRPMRWTTFTVSLRRMMFELLYSSSSEMCCSIVGAVVKHKVSMKTSIQQHNYTHAKCTKKQVTNWWYKPLNIFSLNYYFHLLFNWPIFPS